MYEEETEKSNNSADIHRGDNRNLLCRLPVDAQAFYRTTLSVWSLNRMHCLPAAIYCGEKEEVKSSFIVFANMNLKVVLDALNKTNNPHTNKNYKIQKS